MAAFSAPLTLEMLFPPLLPLTESLMSTPDILTRIKQEEPFAGGGQFPEERGIPTDPCGGEAENRWIVWQEEGSLGLQC